MSTPVQILAPAEALPRLESWLATAGLRLYRVPVKDDLVTFMVGVDISEYSEPTSDGRWPVANVVEAYADAVSLLAPCPQPKPRSARRSRVPAGARGKGARS